MTEQLIILVEIILIDLVLAGDNAIIIGMVASQFEDQNRKKIIKPQKNSHTKPTKSELKSFLSD